MEELTIACRKLPPHLCETLPRYQTEGSSGMDLHANIEAPIVLHPGEYRLIPCGIALSIPRGFEGQVRPRSGLAAKHGITILNAPGTIDSDYRGEVCVVLINMGKEDYTVKPLDRIGQIIFTPVARALLVKREMLDDTARSDGGFGHTGIEGTPPEA
ncbi:MAG: dUTP diphosphatase [Candidatus Eremiobacteraeota bacterium]|nr:dUTP diphosphatase [Candidatus Eremiobacteraeota bacterium]